MANLVTGAGVTVQAQWDADTLAGVFGSAPIILSVGNQMALSIVDNNTVRARDGVMVVEGRAINIPAGSYEDFKIPTGTANVNQTYYIGWTIGTVDSVEKATQYVSTSKPASASLRSGATSMTAILGTVSLEGITIKSVKRTPGISGTFAKVDTTIQDTVDTLNDSAPLKKGYFIFPNGLHLEWGSVDCSYVNPNVLKGTITWQKPFANGCTVLGIDGQTENNPNELCENVKIPTKNVTSTGAIAYIQNTNSRYSSTYKRGANYLAIGF